jgi:hypothetical protein
LAIFAIYRFFVHRFKLLLYFFTIFIGMRIKTLCIATVVIFGIISCADLPKTYETRFVSESPINDDYEILDDATRQETEFKADSIIKKFNTKFAEDCTPYSEDQINSKKQKRLDCVTFK